MASKRATRRGQQQDEKQHEGWVDYFSFSTSTWNRFLMTLSNKVLYLTFVDRSGQKVVAKSISLSEDTQLNEFPDSFAFELVVSGSSTSPGATARGSSSQRHQQPQQRQHLFQFLNENDRDLWKAFILGLTTGVVPDDVKLLPGQLIDIRETVRNVRPPPLPRRTILPDSPNVSTSGVYAEPAGDDDVANRLPVSTDADKTTPSPSVSNAVDHESDEPTGDVDTNAACRLMRRTSELNNKILATKTTKSPVSPVSQHQFGVRQSSSFRFSAPPPTQNDFPPHLIPGWSPPNFAPTVVGYQPGDGHVALEQLIHQSTSRSMNNNETHPFYLDPDLNRIPPPWFVDVDRSKAEVILTLAAKYGNVLMRPSTASSITGKYVITMRSDTSGGSHLSHYAVERRPDGFRIEVDNEQPSLYCLSDVMDFFVVTVGLSFARPLRPMGGSVRAAPQRGVTVLQRPARTATTYVSVGDPARLLPAATVGRTVLNRIASVPSSAVSGVGGAPVRRQTSAAMFIAPDSIFNVGRLSLSENRNNNNNNATGRMDEETSISPTVPAAEDDTLSNQSTLLAAERQSSTT